MLTLICVSVIGPDITAKESDPDIRCLTFKSLRGEEGAAIVDEILTKYSGETAIRNDRENLNTLYRIWPVQLEPFFIYLDMLDGLRNGASKEEVSKWLNNKELNSSFMAQHLTPQAMKVLQNTLKSYSNYNFYMSEVGYVFENYFKNKPENEWPAFKDLNDEGDLIYIKELPYAESCVKALCEDIDKWEMYQEELEKSGWFEPGFFSDLSTVESTEESSEESTEELSEESTEESSEESTEELSEESTENSNPEITAPYFE